MQLYSLSLIDKDTGQVIKHEAVQGKLDMSSKLQRQLYLDTINSLTHSEVIQVVEGREHITITLRNKIPMTSTESELELDVYEEGDNNED